jgi:hypothetical protein
MVDAKRGAGEAAERLQQRKRKGVIGVLFAAGLCSGAYIGYSMGSQDLDFTAPWSPTACLVIAAVYLLAMAWGNFALSRHMDEVERANSYKAGSAAGAAYLIVYPVWFLLWKGGFSGEPVHWALFILFWTVLAVSSLYYRYR